MSEIQNIRTEVETSNTTKNPGTEKFGHSKIDSYGFERRRDFDEKSYEEFMSTYLMILARRAMKWRSLVLGNSKISKSSKLTDPQLHKLKRYCRKGIPGEYRPQIWMEVSGAAERMQEQPNLYKQLLSQSVDSTVTECIKLDIHRTFPENIYFVNSQDPNGLQRPLRHVLQTFALNNPHIGYCQGLNYVAGMMLLIIRSEEKVFWLLDTLARKLLPDFYSSDMVAVKAEQELLGDLVRWKMPELYSHLNTLGMHWSLIGMKWFICLFADVLPVETVLRIWDSLFYEGSKILLRAALILILEIKDKLLAAKDFSEAVENLKYVVNSPLVLNCHTFMENIFKQTGSMPRKKISKMREACTRRVLAET